MNPVLALSGSLLLFCNCMAHPIAAAATNDFVQSVHLYPDNDALIEFEDAQKLFSEGHFQESQTLNFGRLRGRLWVRLHLKQQNLAQESALLISYPGIDRLHVYQRDPAGRLHEQISGQSSFHKDALGWLWVPQFIIPVQSQVLWLNLESSFALRLPIKLIDQSQAEMRIAQHTAIFTLFFGFVLAVFIHNLAQYIFSRKVLFLFHSCKVLSWHVVLQLAVSGIWRAISGDASMYSTQVIIIISALFGLIFTALFAATYIHSLPWLKHLVKVSLWACGLEVITFFLLPEPIAYARLAPLFNATALGGLILIVCAAVHGAYQRQREAIILLASLGSLATGIIFYILHINNIVELGALGEYGWQIGACLEAVVLSTALGYQIRQLEHEKLFIEQEEATNQRFRTFVQILCHDLANGLTRIFLALEVRRKRLINAPEHRADEDRFLNRIESSTNHLNDILRNVREMEAVALGKQEVALEPVSMRKAVYETITRLASRLAEKGVTIEVQSEHEQEFLAQANMRMLVDSVLVNLLSNAIKFSPKKSRIEIKLIQDNEHVFVAIQDHGIGMGRSLAQRVFDPEAATTRPGTSGEKGTGFELPLAHTIINSFGGSIALRSNDEPPMTGTTFAIALPTPLRATRYYQQQLTRHKSLWFRWKNRFTHRNPEANSHRSITAEAYFLRPQAILKYNEHISLAELETLQNEPGQTSSTYQVQTYKAS